MLLSLITAGLSLAAAGVASFNRPVPWTALLTGFVIASAGFQIANARRVFGLTAPLEIRPWMLPASIVCYAAGGILALLGVRALCLLALAI